MRIFVYTVLIAIYILSRFFHAPVISYSTGAVALVALAISAVYARGLYLISGAIFLLIGFVLFIQSKQPWHTFILHFEQVLGLLSLFFVLPFMNSIIRVGRYDKHLSLLLQDQAADLNHLYRRSSGVCHILGLFLNIATAPLLIKSLNVILHDLPKKVLTKFYSQNLLRAYALCLTWSPMEVMVSSTIDITKVQYFIIFPILLSMAIIMLGFDWLMSSYKYKGIQIAFHTPHFFNKKKGYKKAFELIGMLLLFIFMVSTVQHFLQKGFLFSVVLLIIPFSAIWSLFIKKGKRYFTVAIQHWKERTRGLANYFFMFLGAGLFVEMLADSQLLSFLKPVFELGTEKTLILYSTIGLYFFITSLIGFHPLVGFALLAELLQPFLVDIPSIPLSIVLICSSLSTVMFSPFNISVSILSDELNAQSYRIGSWNMIFALGYIGFGIVVACFVEMFFMY